MAEMIYYLPSDIKTVIFSQIHVDSILQCKHVCKTWQVCIHELLNDPSFVDIHTRRFLSSPSPAAAAEASSYSFLIARETYNKDWSIVGTCNGLVCLVRKRYDNLRLNNVCICNPVTKEYVNLLQQFDPSHPSDPKHFHLPVINEVIATGFGYVPSTKEYKFVRITCAKENMYVSVYTLGSGTWRMKKIDKEDPCHDQLRYCNNVSKPDPAAGLLFNGALYWSRHLIHGIDIISFDLEKEEFRMVLSPPHSTLYIDNIIGVLGGCFCLIRTYRSDGSKYILVMNKEEEEGDYNWTKKYRIEPEMKKNISLPFILEAKTFSNYDYMKFTSTRSYLDHHLNNNSIDLQMVEWFEILLPYMRKFEMIRYTRSFVSLKAFGENADVATTDKNRKEMAAMIYSLPYNIKTEIFSQLPIDSIIQCKCVCKPWLTLIGDLLNDPSFVDIHTRRFLSSSPPSPAAAEASSYSFLIAREKKYNKDWSIVGTCNGLVCLVRKRYDHLRLNVCICNPVTKEYVNLIPQFDLSRPSDPKHFHVPVIDAVIGIGFGYVPSSKEYKCVSITCAKENMYVSVYTLGSGTWRMKKVDKEDPCHDQLRHCDNINKPAPATGLLFNGALYWSRHLIHGIDIISFDLEKEEFRIVLSPPHSTLYIDKIIGVLGGCFCLIRSYYSDGSQDILVMNKEEEEGDYNWTKKFRIEPTMKKNITSTFILEAQTFSNYDYMNFTSTRSYLDHHLNNNSIDLQMVEWFEILLPYMRRFEMIRYIRSLVSLKTLGENADVATTEKKRVDIYDPSYLLDSR